MEKLYTRILCATDLTESAEWTLRHALAMAACHGAGLVLLHVMPEMEASVVNYVASVMGEDRFVAYELEHEQEVQKQLGEWLERLQVERGLIETVEVLHGSPAPEILRAAERHAVDLVVLGSHGKGALHYAFLGSVAERVVRHADRPVLVVPPRPA